MPKAKAPAKKQSQDYRHKDVKAILRPEGGAQDVFPQNKRRPPQSYPALYVQASTDLTMGIC